MMILRTNAHVYLVGLQHIDIKQQMIVRALGRNPEEVKTPETMSKYGMYVCVFSTSHCLQTLRKFLAEGSTSTVGIRVQWLPNRDRLPPVMISSSLSLRSTLSG